MARGTDTEDLIAFVQSETRAGRLVPVPQKPGRVYWYSQRRGQLTETTAARARSWLGIQQTGRAARGDLQRFGRAAMAEQGLGRRRGPPTSIPEAIEPANVIPFPEQAMSNDNYWFDQYDMGQFGPGRAVPVTRRNPKKRRKSRANPSALLNGPVEYTTNGQPFVRLPNGQCRFIKMSEAARMNGGHDFPDPTHVRGALVPASYSRHNPVDVRVAKNGQPYILLPNGQCRFISKEEAADMGVSRAAMNPRRKRRGKKNPNAYPYRQGQFSTSGTGGTQPVNRRNPRKKAKGKTKAQAQAQKAMKLYHSGKARTLKEAWRMVKGQAKKNGRKRRR
jgi:hypothetical protein